MLADLRDFRENKRSGSIPCFFSCPCGMLELWTDPDSPYHKEIFAQDKIYVLYGESGWRLALSATTAMETGMASVAHIEGGFGEWAKAERPIEKVDSDLS